MPLSDTQSLMLTAAAQHPDGIAAPPASLPPAPRGAVAKALLRAGLLAPAGAERDDSSVAWKLDGAMVVLRITEGGLRAIGVEQRVMPAQADETAQEAPATTMPANRHSKSPAASGAECMVGCQPAG